MKKIILIFCCLGLFACGDSKPNLTNRELVQNVKLIPYNLDSIVVKAEFYYQDGTVEKIEKVLSTSDGTTQDQIKKALEDNRFVLLINDKKARIAVDAGGRIEYDEDVKKSLKGCHLRAKALVRGNAENINFSLRWQLQAEISGEGCSEDTTLEYVDFQTKELEALNMSAVSNLINISDQNLDQTRLVKMEVHLKGTSS